MLLMTVIWVGNAAAALWVALREAHRPLRALTWVLIFLLFPVGGLVAYALLTRPLRVQRRGVG
ncbi:MAG: PLDc N-terminal domain-containing protein, partial [Alicyclobacillaceae bacterium]|nr:PLDc N-terminal domain-containing protein [Alicyclobacillaceae bacterium]